MDYGPLEGEAVATRTDRSTTIVWVVEAGVMLPQSPLARQLEARLSTMKHHARVERTQ
jgi:hypothetical protein